MLRAGQEVTGLGVARGWRSERRVNTASDMTWLLGGHQLLCTGAKADAGGNFSGQFHQPRGSGKSGMEAGRQGWCLRVT